MHAPREVGQIAVHLVADLVELILLPVIDDALPVGNELAVALHALHPHVLPLGELLRLATLATTEAPPPLAPHRLPALTRILDGKVVEERLVLTGVRHRHRLVGTEAAVGKRPSCAARRHHAGQSARARHHLAAHVRALCGTAHRQP